LALPKVHGGALEDPSPLVAVMAWHRPAWRAGGWRGGWERIAWAVLMFPESRLSRPGN